MTGLAPTQQTLVLRHIAESDPARFEVVRLSDGKVSDATEVPSSVGFQVEGCPGSDLAKELRWYVESFLDYPFPPETEHAERVLSGLRRWGEVAFSALFAGGRGRDFYRDAIRAGMEGLRLVVSSDDPRILAWPWEALRDPEREPLSLSCRISRKLNQLADPMPLPDGLPRDRVNILLVTARPYEEDVGYRSISRPLLELFEDRNLPARVTVLRPPTLTSLREHLRQHPGTYHILHFDGHGGYGEAAYAAGVPFRLLRSAEGLLVFETEEGEPDPVTAETLGALLREHRLPAVVLNACQSGMVDERAKDAFASVAASLVKAGVRSVAAMAYSLYVSGAGKFLPAFYGRLFETGDLSEGARAGRQMMYQEKGRVCVRGEWPLEDWLVPVVYEQEALDFSFDAAAAPGDGPRAALPPGAADEENPYGFVGRDAAIHALERRMRRKPTGILIHGLGGVGKTTLARGFLHWLRQTEGLGSGAFWFGMHEVRSAEYVVNRMGEVLFGAAFIPAPLEKKVAKLVKTLREQHFVVVWDNFESVRGVEGASGTAKLSPADQEVMKKLLVGLRGGRTKILITSRSEEEWLGRTNRQKIALGGLGREERWEYCRVILADQGMKVDWADPDISRLMDVLEGHPLMMRAVLPLLEVKAAGEIEQELRTNLVAMGLADPDAEAKLHAMMQFVRQSIPAELRPLLVAVSLHERFIEAKLLIFMASAAKEPITTDMIDRFERILVDGGLMRDRGAGVFELHPVLTAFLRSEEPNRVDEPVRDAWTRAFVGVMARMADLLSPKPAHELRQALLVHEWNLRRALDEARRLDLGQEEAALTQVLGMFMVRDGDLSSAETLFLLLAEIEERNANPEGVSGALHELGTIALARREFGSAGDRFRRALAIEKERGDEKGTACTYHQLGRVEQAVGKLDEAERMYRESLKISELRGWESAAGTYHQLGRLAEMRESFGPAMEWYEKSLEIKRRVGDEFGVALTLHQIGVVAQTQGKLEKATDLYHEALEIRRRIEDESGAAQTLHHLGMVADARGKGNEARIAYFAALEIKERQGDRYGAASTYAQLGILAGKEGAIVDAARWLIRSIQTFRLEDAPREADRNIHNLRVFLANASPEERVEAEAAWRDADLGEFPGRGGAAERGGAERVQ